MYIGDEELCSAIRRYMEENVRRGEKMVEGLLLSLGYNVTRQRIRDCIRSMDPIGNEIRTLKRLKRRVYEVPGCHYLWHLDGCHKLIKFGFVVHTCIDGFSRYLIYSVCRDNNRANTVLNAFKEGSMDVGVLPSKIRTDKGGENVNVLCFMYEVFGEDADCCLTGKSTGNQKVERVHRDSTEKALEPYILLFRYFVVRGLNVDNNLHLFMLHFLFMARINESLMEFVKAWNHHKLRTVNNRTPTQLLLLGQLQGTTCGVNVYEDEFSIYDILRDAEDVVDADNQVVCDSRFCPFNELQMQQFEAQVSPCTLQSRIDVSCYDMLFEQFGNALRVSMTILDTV